MLTWIAMALGAPTLYAWVDEDAGVQRLQLAVTVGDRFEPDRVIRIALASDGARRGQILCRPSDAATLRCRIERAGEQCPTCGTVLDVPLDGEAAAPGMRLFAGQRANGATVVAQIDAKHFGPLGLLSATAHLERPQP